jgi:heme/copper-type cytochrome/quinol oxidase subunit 4
MNSLKTQQEINLITIIAFAATHFLLSMIVFIFLSTLSSYICFFAIVSMIVNAIIIIFASITLSSVMAQLYSSPL